MPECHSCKHNGLSWPGCLRCKGPADTNHKGQTFVSLDAGSERGQTLGECEASEPFDLDKAVSDAAAFDLDSALNEVPGVDMDKAVGKAAFEMAECFEVEPDAGCDPHAAACVQVAGMTTVDPEHEAEPDTPLEMARKLAFVFTELSTEEFDLVRRLMRGENMAEISKASGVTRACVSARVRTLARKHPAFLFLRNNKGVKSVIWPYQAAPSDSPKC